MSVAGQCCKGEIWLKVEYQDLHAISTRSPSLLRVRQLRCCVAGPGLVEPPAGDCGVDHCKVATGAGK